MALALLWRDHRGAVHFWRLLCSVSDWHRHRGTVSKGAHQWPSDTYGGAGALWPAAGFVSNLRGEPGSLGHTTGDFGREGAPDLPYRGRRLPALCGCLEPRKDHV